MATNVMTGAYRVFIRKNPLDADQIDTCITEGRIPTSEWKQLFTEGDVTVRFSRETIDLKTNQEGLLKTLYSSYDTVEIEIPIADISYETVVEILRINPTDISTSSSWKKLAGSYMGVDASSNPLSLLLYHLAYDSSNNSDIPKVGAGSDPTALLFFKVASASNLELAYTPGAQQILRVTLKAFATDGTTNKGVLGVFGSLAAAV